MPYPGNGELYQDGLSFLARLVGTKMKTAKGTRKVTKKPANLSDLTEDDLLASSGASCSEDMYSPSKGKNTQASTSSATTTASNDGNAKQAGEKKGSTSSTSASTKNKKSMTEYSREKRLYQRAIHLIKTVDENMSKGVMQTPENIESYAWAKSQVEKFTKMQEDRKKVLPTRAPPLGQGKRMRSAEEIKEAKKLKTSASTSSSSKNLDKIPLNEIVKQNLKVSIVDLSEPNWRIPADKFVMIDTAIVENISKRIDSQQLTTLPEFDMSERYYGFRIVSCETQGALDLLREIVQSLGELWEGARISLKSLSELPKPPKAKINIPGNCKKEDIIKILKISNSNLPVESWTVMGIGDFRNGKTPIVFRIDEHSAQILGKQNNQVKFTLRKLPVNISRSEGNVAALLAEPDPVDAIASQITNNLVVDKETTTPVDKK